MDPGGQSSRVIHQDWRQSERCRGFQTESFCDVESRAVGRQRSGRYGFLHYFCRHLVESDRDDRFERECSSRSDATFVAGSCPRECRGAVCIGTSDSHVYRDGAIGRLSSCRDGRIRPSASLSDRITRATTSSAVTARLSPSRGRRNASAPPFAGVAFVVWLRFGR